MAPATNSRWYPVLFRAQRDEGSTRVARRMAGRHATTATAPLQRTMGASIRGSLMRTRAAVLRAAEREVDNAYQLSAIAR